MNPIIIKNLKKSYGPVEAVKGVSFDVKPGEIFGLIGPDGAGKTTIIRTIVSLLNPDQGEVWFQGKEVRDDAAAVRANIGYMPQRFSLYRDLSVDENLRFFGDLFKVPKALQKERLDKLYAFSKLGPFKKRRADALSGGMKQKLALSCMLMHEPQVVVLDEPTYGVDPVSRSEFWDILKMLAKNGTSILVTTAYMDEAGLCDRVGLIFEGRILALDNPDRVLEQYEHPLYLIETDNAHDTYEQLNTAGFGADCTLFGNGVHLTDHGQHGLDYYRNVLAGKDIAFNSIKTVQPQLEDLFLKLMAAGQTKQSGSGTDQEQQNSGEVK